MTNKKKKFKAKFTLTEKLTKGGRKKDSNYYKNLIAKKKIAYITHLATNLDQLIITNSLTLPKFTPGLIDRFLIFSQMEKIKPIIMMTKIDLVSQEEALNKKKIYETIGYQVFLISNKTLEGLELIKEILKDKRSAIVGHSGVGKTSMLNHVDSAFCEKIQEISDYTKKGRHTTSTIRLYELSFGGIIYDMPGLKEMDFTTLSKRELSNYYKEFKRYDLNCHFSNCLHLHEKRCGVKEAVLKKEIHPIRYKNYLTILKSLNEK